MNPDAMLRDRFQRAGLLETPPVEAALAGVQGRVAVRHRRRRTETLVVVVAIWVLLGVATGLVALRERSGPRPATTPTPSATMAPRKVVPPPPGHETNLTVEQAGRFVLDQIARHESQVGGALAPARILSVEFQPAAPGGPRDDTWHVRFRGTWLNCSSWCSGHPGGRIWFSDEGPDALGGAERLLDLVCQHGVVPEDQVMEYPPCSDLILGGVEGTPGP